MLANWLSGTVAAAATRFLAFVGDWVKLSFLTSVPLDFVSVVSFAVCFSFVGSTGFSLFSVEPLSFWFIVVVLTTLSLLTAEAPSFWFAVVSTVFGLDKVTSLPLISLFSFIWLEVTVVSPFVEEDATSSAFTLITLPNIKPPKITLPTIKEAAPPPFFFFLIEYFNCLFKLSLNIFSLTFHQAYNI